MGEGTNVGSTAVYADSSCGAGVELADRPTEAASLRFREVLDLRFGVRFATDDDATELARS
jgi:hypothetical protein